MASRWVDSGINWLDVTQNRTSWVIDELYLAFKEKCSLFYYYRNTNLDSIELWDFHHYKRDQEKLNEIILTLHEWLRSDYASFPAIMNASGVHEWIGWHDDTTSYIGNTVDTNQTYGGVPCWNSDAGGALEVDTGVDLGFIRVIDSNIRINAGILQDLFTILSRLEKQFVVRWRKVNGSNYIYGASPPIYLFIMETDRRRGSGNTLQDAVTVYESNDPAWHDTFQSFPVFDRIGNFYVQDFATYSISQENQTLLNDTTYANKGMVDSKGNGINMDEAGARACVFHSDNNENEFPQYSYQTLFLEGTDGTNLILYNEPYPKSITGYTVGQRTTLESNMTVYINSGLSAVSGYHN